MTDKSQPKFKLPANHVIIESDYDSEKNHVLKFIVTRNTVNGTYTLFSVNNSDNSLTKIASNHIPVFNYPRWEETK